MNDESQSDLLRVKVDNTGLDVRVSNTLPKLVERVFPAKLKVRRDLVEEIRKSFVEKISKNLPFDDAELEIAEYLLSEPLKKFVRAKRIDQRAFELRQELPFNQLLQESGYKDTNKETSDDWVNKFREDAGLVDEELVREIYARVLNEEGTRPGSFSLRTLAVLRYLDRDAATAFGLLQKVVMDGICVPQTTSTPDDVLTKTGLAYSTMLLLVDAGLVNLTPSEYTKTYERDGDYLPFGLCGHNRVLKVQRTDRKGPLTLKLSVHMLTRPGIELATIAQCEPDEAAFQKMITWLASHLRNSEIWATPMSSTRLTVSTSATWERVFAG